MLKNKKRKWLIMVGVVAIAILGIIFVMKWSGDSLRRLSGKQVVIQTEDASYLVELYDNPTADDLYSRLPLTLTSSDYPGYDEKVLRLGDGLSMEGAPLGDNPKIPEVGYYEPGNWIALYYGFIGYWPGKVPLGQIHATTEELAAIPEETTIRIERMED